MWGVQKPSFEEKTRFSILDCFYLRISAQSAVEILLKPAGLARKPLALKSGLHHQTESLASITVLPHATDGNITQSVKSVPKIRCIPAGCLAVWRLGGRGVLGSPGKERQSRTSQESTGFKSDRHKNKPTIKQTNVIGKGLATWTRIRHT